jgi:glycerophosphoryl diester phosphodiesterase
LKPVRPITRIAHAYGNRRETLQGALAADVDEIEVDLWHRAGRVEVRHERRLGWLPVLMDRHSRGSSLPGPWALPLPRRRYLRLDLRPLSLTELLETTDGKRRLLLDVKAREGQDAGSFARALVRAIEAAGANEWVAICGQAWPVLDRIREQAPGLEVRYSMQSAGQWEKYVERLERGAAARAVCMHYRMYDAPRAAFLKTNGIAKFCWTVDDPGIAFALIEGGVDGVISNDLRLLASLRDPAR